MYNSIYPININYRKHNQYNSGTQNTDNSNSVGVSDDNQKHNTFPNGSKVAIDYSKGQINISQVLMDFRNTILAINAPNDIQEEVSVYLNLVEKESLKENPSKDIIVANLKNASKISDAFIAKSLNKPSNVVEGWIDALFLQKINLKSDPNEINPDFLLEFPQKAKERIQNSKLPDNENPVQDNAASGELKIYDTDKQPEFLTVSSKSHEVYETPQEVEENNVIDDDFSFEDTSDDIEIENTIDVDEKNNVLELKKDSNGGSFAPLTDADIKARELFVAAKKMPQTNQGDTDALNLLNEALGVLAENSEVNENIKAAIHFERGKIFDDYDYVDYALKDYWEATKAGELNLKSQAFFRSGSIYDEFGEFSPALSNYLSAVAYSGEAENPNIQTRALTSIAGLYAKQYDSENAAEYSDLAVDVAQDSNDFNLIADTYSTSANNYEYLGENEKALDSYKNAVRFLSSQDESFAQMAYNYEQASKVMEKLGNFAKAKKLQAKANLYYQKAQLQEGQLEAAS